MRIYEIMFILRPELPEEEVDRIISQFEGVVTSTGGTVQKAEKWARRRLAYDVKKCREGQFLLFTIECDPPTVREFERRLKVSDQVIKFMTVRVDLDWKRLAKVKKKREERAARRKKPASSAAPAAPAAAPTTPTAPPAGAEPAPQAV